MNGSFQFLQALVDDIEADLCQEMNILSLSQKCGVSPWHFQRLFKSLVGDTLGGYIRGRRLTRGARLLLDSDQSIIDVAFGVGFNSHEAFTRSFKAYFSMSPKEFRRARPKVLLNEKPVLSQSLIRHISQEITREPLITHRPALTVVGYPTRIPSPFASTQSNCLLMYDAWMRLFERQQSIPNRLGHTFYGLTLSESGNFTEDELTHIAGVAVSPPLDAPPGMVQHDFPEQLVAIFDVASIDTETADRTIDYIYGYWLPNSGYRRGMGSDYELMEGIDRHETHQAGPGPGSKYVIPLCAD